MTRYAGIVLARAAIHVALPWMLVLLGAAPAAAQQPDRAALEVVITAAETAEPIAGAQVLVLGTRIGGLTGAQGRARLSGLVPGVIVVEVRFLGYRTVRFPVELRAGRTTERALALGAEPIPLREVRVEASGRRLAPGAADGFYQRQRRGIGRFITRTEIEQHRPRRFSDLLRMVPGIRLTCDNMSGSCVAGMSAAPASPSIDVRAARTSGAENACPVQYYVDGIYQPHLDVNDLRPDDIEGVEIYAHGHQAPARYSIRKNARCGVVLIWMRLTLRP